MQQLFDSLRSASKANYQPYPLYCLYVVGGWMGGHGYVLLPGLKDQSPRKLWKFKCQKKWWEEQSRYISSNFHFFISDSISLFNGQRTKHRQLFFVNGNCGHRSACGATNVMHRYAIQIALSPTTLNLQCIVSQNSSPLASTSENVLFFVLIFRTFWLSMEEDYL